MRIRNLITVTAVTAALALSAPLAAQDYEQEQDLPGQQQQTMEVSEQQLQQFVDAQTSIVEIQQDFSARLQGVEDPDQAHELQVQANEEMTGAVEDAGLDVQTYNEIAMAIQNDPELQDRLTQMMQQ